MKNFWIVSLLIVSALFAASSASAKDDFLTSEEVNLIRDADDSGKRVLLYLKFAQQRLDAAQQKTVSWKQAGAGEAIQKNLADYTSILEALDVALEGARKERDPMNKPLKELEAQANHFLKVLQQLNNAPIRSDYQFTLDEAVQMTQDELAEVKKGGFPEIKERKPPTDLPASPPPASSSGGNSAGSSGGAGEGPPRKKSRTPSNTP